jgi:hypothetical protein
MILANPFKNISVTQHNLRWLTASFEGGPIT